MAVLVRRATAFFAVLLVVKLREASGLLAPTRSRDLPKTLGQRSKASSSANSGGGLVQRFPEEFSVAADQALQNLSTQFSEFRNVLASRSTQLTEALRREERVNHAVEDANARISKAIGGLKHDNQGLRRKAKTLTNQNEQLRGELRTLQSRLHAAEAFALSGVEGSSDSEASDIAAAEDPPPPTPPLPPTNEAVDSKAKNVATMSAAETDASSTAAQSEGSVRNGNATQADAVAPAAQTEEADDGAGYADAFAGSDQDGGSIVEQPSSDNDGPGDGMGDGTGDGEGYGPALLAVSAKRHRRSRRHGAAGRKRLRRRRHATRRSHSKKASSALPQIPHDLLPSTAEGFAKLEKNSVASLQHRFDLQLQRLHAKHDELLQEQASLDADRQSVKALHSRLAAAVKQLEARHSRLQRRARSIAGFLEHLAVVAQGPEAKAAAALRAMPAAPGGK